MADYSNDATISAFDVPEDLTAPKKSTMSGRRQDLQPNVEDLQPNAEYSPYSLDPTINAFNPMESIGGMMGGQEEKLATRPQGNPYFGKALEQMFKLRQGAQAAGLSALDLPLGLPAQIAGGLTYAGARLGATPERAQQLSEYPTNALSYLQPGKLATLTDRQIGQGTESYELSPISQAMGLINKYGAQPAIDMLINQGMAPQDAQQLVINAPLIAGVGIKTGQLGYRSFKNAPAWMQELKPETARIEPQMNVSQMPQSIGAAQATPEAMLRANVQSAIANTSPELQTHIQSKPLESVNVPAVETRALEEKHGVDLTAGQRTGDLNRYVDEWNARGKTDTLSNHFANQPKQLADAFENSKLKHAPDIPSTADASELGQHEINGLAAKDKIRTDNIDNAYLNLKDKWQELRGTTGSDDFPVDGKKFLENTQTALKDELLHHDVPDSISKILDELKENNGEMGFSNFLKFNQKLGQKMKEGTGSERAAAFVVRQELQKIPLVDEAAVLKPIADTAISLAKERFDVIKTNPAYKAANKEALDAKDAASDESLNAANFHKKFVANATPEAIRRMKAEIPADDIAHQAITFGELERAKSAAVNASERNLTPEQFVKFLKNNKSGLRESLSPEAMQDVSEIGALTSKIGMPKTGVFNYSNTYSSELANLAKQGLTSAAEAKLTSMTGGASYPITQLGRQWFSNLNKEGFAKRATDPTGGLTKE